MARRRRVFGPGLHYHVIARGNHREPTFVEPEDHLAYLDRVARYRRRDGVGLLAYCLMPNHVHLLVRAGHTPLATFMQSVQQSYTQRHNRLYRKRGHLFEGRYRAILCDDEPYLLTLVRYIHLNPVRAGLVDAPEKYPHSGHQAYLRGHDPYGLDTELVLRLLGGRAAYRDFVLAGLGEGHRPDLYLEPAPPAPASPGLASRGPSPSAVAPRPARRSQPTTPLATVLVEVAGQLGVTPDALRAPGRDRPLAHLRGQVARTLVRDLGYPLVAVAAALNRDPATISLQVSGVRLC